MLIEASDAKKSSQQEKKQKLSKEKFKQRYLRMRERLRAKKYDPRVIQELMDDFGVEESAAIMIANTTYDGIYADDGGVHAWQTYCHILGYDEYVDESPGQAEGREKTKGDLRAEFDRYGIDYKNQPYDKAVDDLLRAMQDSSDH